MKLQVGDKVKIIDRSYAAELAERMKQPAFPWIDNVVLTVVEELRDTYKVTNSRSEYEVDCVIENNNGTRWLACSRGLEKIKIFKPVEFKVTLNSQEEVDRMYCVFNRTEIVRFLTNDFNNNTLNSRLSKSRCDLSQDNYLKYWNEFGRLFNHE